MKIWGKHLHDQNCDKPSYTRSLVSITNQKANEIKYASIFIKYILYLYNFFWNENIIPIWNVLIYFTTLLPTHNSCPYLFIYLGRGKRKVQGVLVGGGCTPINQVWYLVLHKGTILRKYLDRKQIHTLGCHWLSWWMHLENDLFQGGPYLDDHMVGIRGH